MDYFLFQKMVVGESAIEKHMSDFDISSLRPWENGRHFANVIANRTVSLLKINQNF